MKLNRVFLIFGFGLLSVACQQHVSTVEALPSQTSFKISQNLVNDRIPTPDEVQNNTVPAASDACEEFKKKIPADWFQDKIEVPEDPNSPDGHKIKIFYYGKIFENSTPTVFFNGGPGADSHSSFRVLTASQKDFDPKNQISFVFIDQRGNGCSDFYPQMPPAPISDNDKLAVLNRLRFYGSRGIVSDAEYVRNKLLGDKKWNVFGQSYGGFIVHRYMIMAPQNINASFSHANVIQSDGYERMRNRVSSQARVLSIYLSQFSEDQQKLEKLRNYLSLDRCFESSDKIQKVCGYDVLENLTQLIGFSNQWGTVHQWIGIMAPESEVSQEGINQYVATFVFQNGPSNPLNSKKWSDKVISWVDRNIVPLDSYECVKMKNDLLLQGIDLEKVLISECMAALQVAKPDSVDSRAQIIKNLVQDLMTLEELYKVLAANVNLSFNLYSGQRDTFVPMENFTEELNKIGMLSNVHYTNFSGSGHDGFRTEPKVWNDLLIKSK